MYIIIINIQLQTTYSLQGLEIQHSTPSFQNCHSVICHCRVLYTATLPTLFPILGEFWKILGAFWKILGEYCAKVGGYLAQGRTAEKGRKKAQKSMKKVEELFGKFRKK